jgi:hypothetical protein
VIDKSIKKASEKQNSATTRCSWCDSISIVYDDIELVFRCGNKTCKILGEREIQSDAWTNILTSTTTAAPTGERLEEWLARNKLTDYNTLSYLILF